jgi:CRP/FNR family transcriptional regulator, cyclic AMP receptor protein
MSMHRCNKPPVPRATGDKNREVPIRRSGSAIDRRTRHKIEMTVIGLERLRQHDFFRRLDDLVLADIVRCLQQHHYPAGATVFAQNDEQDDVFVVLTGHLRLTTYSLAGREVVFHDLHPGDLVGELSAIDGAPRGANMTVVTDAELARLGAADFTKLLRKHPDFAVAILARLTRLIRSLNRRFHLLTAPVPTRVCAELFRLAGFGRISDNTARIVPAPKHLDIANRINTHREAVSRMLSDLQRHKIIRRDQGELIVLDMAALGRLAEGGSLQPLGPRGGQPAAPGKPRRPPVARPPAS